MKRPSKPTTSLHSNDARVIQQTLAAMNIQSPSDLGWMSPHPYSRDSSTSFPYYPERKELATIQTETEIQTQTSAPPTPYSPPFHAAERATNQYQHPRVPYAQTLQSISAILPSRSPEARKSASFISSMWKERFGTNPAPDPLPSPMDRQPFDAKASSPVVLGLDKGLVTEPEISLAEMEEKIEMDRVEYELALAIERKNTLLNLKKMLRANADAHVEEQRKLIQKERLEAAEHFERVQESLSVAICSRVLQEANKAFSYVEKPVRNLSTEIESRSEAFLDRKVRDAIQEYILEYKQKQNKELEMEMEITFQDLLKKEEEYVNSRRRYWRERAKKDAEEAHMLKIQQELLRLQSDMNDKKSSFPQNSSITLNEKSIVEELSRQNPQDFLEKAKR